MAGWASVLAAAVRTSGKFAAHQGGGVTAEAASSLFGGVQRAATYLGNKVVPNVFPTMDTLIDLFHRGRLSATGLKDFCGSLGIDYDPNEREQWEQDIWRRVVDSAEPHLTMDQALTAYRQGNINLQSFRTICRWHGFWRTWTQDQLLELSEMVDPSAALALYRQGDITEARYRELLFANGMVKREQQDYVLKVSAAPTYLDAVRAYYRGDIDGEALEKVALRNGLVKEEDQTAAYRAAEELPSPSDLVSFAVREVWNQEVVQRFGFDEEFDTIPEFHWWMKATGMYGSPEPGDFEQNPYKHEEGIDHWPTGTPRLPPRGGLDTWAKAYWRAHWQLPSPTQGYEFLHRLRPNRIGRYRATVPDVQPFVFDDLALLLKTADYPKPFRDRLAAISYRTITRVDLRRLYDQDIIDQAEVYEQNLDYGYAPADARFLTDFIVKDRASRRLKKVKAKELARAERLYRAGMSTELQYTEALIAGGMAADEAQATVASAALDQAEETALLAIKTVRQLYGRWELDRVDARVRLRRLGLPDARIEEQLDRWELEREQHGRRATASQISRWVVRGVLKPGAAVHRLQAMGYDPADAMRIIRVARQDHDLLTARAAKATAQTATQARRAAEAEVRAAQRQAFQVARALARGGTPARLAKWLKEGLVSRQEAFLRLQKLGWTAADANHHLDVAQGLTGSTPTNGQQTTLEPPAP